MLTCIPVSALNKHAGKDGNDNNQHGGANLIHSEVEVCNDSSLYKFELHKPSLKGTEVLFQVIKAITIMFSPHVTFSTLCVPCGQGSEVKIAFIIAQKEKNSQPRSSKPAAQHIYRQMYFVHL